MASEAIQYRMRGKVWRYPGMAGWHFVSLPKRQAAEISREFEDAKKGWGSLPVTAVIGRTSWHTSIFPDTKSGTYLLPLKAEVRKKENIAAGRMVAFTLLLRPFR